jgi:hypothetical protein
MISEDDGRNIIENSLSTFDKHFSDLKFSEKIAAEVDSFRRFLTPNSLGA